MDADRFCLHVNVEAPGAVDPVQGVVHANEIRDGYVGDARSERQVGDEVQVRVLEVDVPSKRLVLSMRHDYSNAWKVSTDTVRQVTSLPRRKLFKATVEVETAAGYLVSVDLLGDRDPVRALLPAAWAQPPPPIDSKIRVRVADVDEAAGRILVAAAQSSAGKKKCLRPRRG